MNVEKEALAIEQLARISTARICESLTGEITRLDFFRIQSGMVKFAMEVIDIAAGQGASAPIQSELDRDRIFEEAGKIAIASFPCS